MSKWTLYLTIWTDLMLTVAFGTRIYFWLRDR